MSLTFWRSEKSALRMSCIKLRSYSSPASRIGLVWQPLLFTSARIKLLLKVLAKPVIHSSSYHSLNSLSGYSSWFRVWKQVHAACITKSEFRLAQICGLHIIVHAVRYCSIQLDPLLKIRTGGVDCLDPTLRACGPLRRNHQPFGGWSQLGASPYGYFHWIIHPPQQVQTREV